MLDQNAEASTSTASSMWSGNSGRMGRTVRLPSIKPPRDLTLSSVKRTYVPNVNVRRQKPNKASLPVEQSDHLKTGKARDLKKNPHRIWTPREYVQMRGGVFGDGIALSSKKKDALENKEQLKKSKQSKNVSQECSSTVIVKQEIEEEDDSSDNFVEDEEVDNIKKGNNLISPVLIPTNKSFESIASEESSLSTTNTYKINRKQTSEEHGTSYVESQFSDLSLNPNELILIEFPDDLPCLKSDNNSFSDKEENMCSHADKWTQESPAERSSLKDMNEGTVGKLQVMKSGKLQIILNGVVFNVVKVPTSIHQGVVSVRDNGKQMSVDNLGPVQYMWKAVPAALSSSLS